MNKAIITATLVACLGLHPIKATEPATPLKPPTSGNPLCPYLFTADPTAIEYEGRLYVYATNDTEEYLRPGRTGGNTYSAIRTLAILSSADLVNWTYHGLIPVGDLCGQWFRNSWAPSVVSRVEADGKTHFYLYFSNSGAGVGVLTATSPLGPWTCPIDHPLVDGSTPGVAPCSAPMDPGAVIDDDGVGWLAFGGGGTNPSGTDALPGNARIIRLKPNLIEVDGSAAEIKAPYHFEANELNYIGGKWVYTYCSTWAQRTDWASLATGKQASGVCSMDYMVSNDPLHTGSWRYMGEYFANPGYVPGASWYNNHTHLHKFGSRYYLLYHTTWLEGAKDGAAATFRSCAINRATVAERIHYISPVTADNVGVAQLQPLNPYTVQEAEQTATGAGIDYDNFRNPTPATDSRLSHLGMAIADIPSGAWTMVRSVDFGTDGAAQLTARLRGRGTLEVRLDDITHAPAATIHFSSAAWRDVTADVSPTTFTGRHDVYFFFTDTRSAWFDRWQFTPHVVADAITSLGSGDERREARIPYDLAGRPLSHPMPPSGLVILPSGDGRAGRKVIVR